MMAPKNTKKIKLVGEWVNLVERVDETETIRYMGRLMSKTQTQATLEIHWVASYNQISNKVEVLSVCDKTLAIASFPITSDLSIERASKHNCGIGDVRSNLPRQLDKDNPKPGWVVVHFNGGSEVVSHYGAITEVGNDYILIDAHRNLLFQADNSTGVGSIDVLCPGGVTSCVVLRSSISMIQEAPACEC